MTGDRRPCRPEDSSRTRCFTGLRLTRDRLQRESIWRRRVGLYAGDEGSCGEGVLDRLRSLRHKRNALAHEMMTVFIRSTVR